MLSAACRSQQFVGPRNGDRVVLDDVWSWRRDPYLVPDPHGRRWAHVACRGLVPKFSVRPCQAWQRSRSLDRKQNWELVAPLLSFSLVYPRRGPPPQPPDRSHGFLSLFSGNHGWSPRPIESSAYQLRKKIHERSRPVGEPVSGRVTSLFFGPLSCRIVRAG